MAEVFYLNNPDAKRDLKVTAMVNLIYSCQPEILYIEVKARFHHKRGKEHSFFFFIDLSALKIKASAKQSKKINKTNRK